VERVGLAAHRWRYGVVLGELILVVGCAYLGWTAVAPQPDTAQIRVHHATAAPAPATGGLALPMAGPVSGVAGRARPAPAFQAPNLSADWLSRLNADDYDLYSRQWQVLQLLMSGVRQYLEQRVVPRLLGH
jgi:hypothetical protein